MYRYRRSLSAEIPCALVKDIAYIQENRKTCVEVDIIAEKPELMNCVSIAANFANKKFFWVADATGCIIFEVTQKTNLNVKETYRISACSVRCSNGKHYLALNLQTKFQSITAKSMYDKYVVEIEGVIKGVKVRKNSWCIACNSVLQSNSVLEQSQTNSVRCHQCTLLQTVSSDNTRVIGENIFIRNISTGQVYNGFCDSNILEKCVKSLDSNKNVLLMSAEDLDQLLCNTSVRGSYFATEKLFLDLQPHAC